MNKHKIKGAFAALKDSLRTVQANLDAMEDLTTEEPPVILQLKLTKREAYVLKHTCRANIRVPNAVVKGRSDIEPNEIANLLDKIRREIGG